MAEISARLAAGETVEALIAEFDGDGATEDNPVLVGLRDFIESNPR